MENLLSLIQENRPLLATIAGVAGVLFMIIGRRIPAFPALLVAALFTGLAAGLAPDAVIASVQKGMGGVLGFIAVIVGLGALLGAFLEAGGGAKAMALGIVEGKSSKFAVWAMGAVGILIAIPVFFDVGLILLIPLVQALSKRTGKASLLFGLPLLAGLATAHAFIPPTPGPIAVAEILGADLGLVIVFGLLAGIPAVIIAGPLYALFAEKRGWLNEFSLNTEDKDTSEIEGFDKSLAWKALATILIPLFLIVIAAFIGIANLNETPIGQFIGFIGHPFVALLIACCLATYLLRPQNEIEQTRLKAALERAFEPTAVILLVTGAGGAFKQVLIDTGAGAAMANAATSMGIAPIVAGFVLAALVRVAQGSATVAMLTAAGLVAPIAMASGMTGYDLALMTISIAAGASVLSHVNDSGFWLVSKYFDLSVSETLRTWTVASTLVGVVGFATAVALSFIL